MRIVITLSQQAPHLDDALCVVLPLFAVPHLYSVTIHLLSHVPCERLFHCTVPRREMRRDGAIHGKSRTAVYHVAQTAAAKEHDGEQPMANLTELFYFSAIVASSSNVILCILLTGNDIPPTLTTISHVCFGDPAMLFTVLLATSLLSPPLHQTYPPIHQALYLRFPYSMSRLNVSYLLTPTSVANRLPKTNDEWTNHQCDERARYIGQSIGGSTPVPPTTLRTVVIYYYTTMMVIKAVIQFSDQT